MTQPKEPRGFLTKPAVIDWLQWANHPDPPVGSGIPDMAQTTLLLIKEYDDAFLALQQQADKLAESLDKASHELELGLIGNAKAWLSTGLAAYKAYKGEK